MPTRNISLTAEQDAFIRTVVDSGEYQNASEAVRDALRTFQQRRREDALRLEALRAQLEHGAGALTAGDATDVGGSKLGAYLARLAPAAPAPTAARRKRSR